MIVRRKLLVGGTATIIAMTAGRRAWGATGPGAGRAAAGLRRPPPVFLVGETGVGKNLAAEVIHRARPRATGPYVSRHLAAMPDADMELFGHAPDARPELPGVWELAHGGTMYLDEIALVRAMTWPKIARTIETGTMRRLGSMRDRASDAWPIMSSAYSLDTRIGTQTLRELVASLDPVILTVPPLRERGDDVQLLADHFLARYCQKLKQPLKTLTPGARRALGMNPWPGNVRHLASVIECAVFLGEHDEIDAEDVAR